MFFKEWLSFNEEYTHVKLKGLKLIKISRSQSKIKTSYNGRVKKNYIIKIVKVYLGN